MSGAGSPRKKARKPARPRTPSVHPPVAAMVTGAISNLRDRKGSSLMAIKKYVAANNRGVDMNRIAPFIRRCLKTGVAGGSIVQTRGTGASGRFRLGKAPSTPRKKKAKRAKKPKVKRAKKRVKKAAAKRPKAKKSAKRARAKKTAKKAKRPAKKAKRAAKPKKARRRAAKK